MHPYLFIDTSVYGTEFYLGSPVTFSPYLYCIMAEIKEGFDEANKIVYHARLEYPGATFGWLVPIDVGGNIQWKFQNRYYPPSHQ